MSVSKLKDNPSVHPMDMSLTDLIYSIQSKQITPIDAVEACFQRIDELNPKVNAFTVLCRERALEEAIQQTERLNAGLEVGILCGVPIGVKDTDCAEGLPTTYGAVPLKDNIAEKDSVQVSRLRAAGAIVVGKTNVPIFGSTILTKNRVYGVSRNPWDLELTPGGSSGGSAAAIASRMVPFATAADGGGSIRNPAAFTATFGLKPTLGVVPMDEGREFGMDRFIECVSYGPITRSVKDAALIMDIIAGYHPDDPRSVPKPVSSYLNRLNVSVKPLKILFSSDFGFISHVDPTILARCQQTIKSLEQFGHTVVVEDFGKAKKSLLPDPGLNWAMAMGVQEKLMVEPNFDHEEMSLLDKGLTSGWAALEDLPVNQLGDVFRYKRELNQAIDDIHQEFDVIASPAMTVYPFNAKGPVPIHLFEVPLHVVGFLSIFNFSGHPASVVPLPPHESGIASLQLVGKRFQDDLLLQLCFQYEQNGEALKWPKL